MKNRNNFVMHGLLLFLAAFLVVRFACAAEPQIPAPAQTLHARLIPALQPGVRGWVVQEAKQVSRNPGANEATVKADIRSRFAGQQLGDADIEALAFLVMMEATQAADKDLKAIMAEVKAANADKSAQRQAANDLKQKESRLNAAARQETAHPAATNLQVRAGSVGFKKDTRAPAAKLDTVADLTESESLRLQLAADRRAKLMETLSNLMKKVSATQSNIVGNLK